MIITTPHYNRPECTKESLSRLRNCNGINSIHVIIVCEPGCEEVVDLCKNCNLPSYEIIINDKLLGLWENKKKCLSLGFKYDSYVLHIEDDILLSQDALNYYLYCYNKYKNDKEIFSITGYNYTNNYTEYLDNKILRRPFYTSWGFATYIDRYNLIKDNWNGSDTELNKYRENNNLYEICPCVARANHIGYIQGKCYNKELIQTMIVQKIANESLLNSYNIKSPEIIANCRGNEWVKMNDSICRSRPGEEYYKSVYLNFWGDNIKPQTSFEEIKLT